MSIDQEKIEWLHQQWAAKMDQVPASDEDVFTFRSEDGMELRRTRKQFRDNWDDPALEGFVVMDIINVSLGESEKKAK